MTGQQTLNKLITDIENLHDATVADLTTELTKLRDCIWMSGDPFAPSFAGWCFHCGTAHEEPHKPDCAWLAEGIRRTAGA